MRRAGLGQGLPDRLGVAGRGEQLEAVLAGVTGARQQHVLARDLAAVARVVLDLGEVGVSQRREDGDRVGALHRDQRVVGGDVVVLGVEAADPLGQFGGDHGGVRRVGHHQELLLAEPVDDQVVEHAPGGVAHHRVAGAAGLDRGRVRDQCVIHRLGGLRPADPDLTHVGQVEQAGAVAHRVVLGGVTGVAQGHPPAGEFGERRPEGFVHVVQGRLSWRRHG